jgi:hypothetical protein
MLGISTSLVMSKKSHQQHLSAVKKFHQHEKSVLTSFISFHQLKVVLIKTMKNLDP